MEVMTVLLLLLMMMLQLNFPLCTIAHTPRLPEHCVEYVRLLMWPKENPFGGLCLVFVLRLSIQVVYQGFCKFYRRSKKLIIFINIELA